MRISLRAVLLCFAAAPLAGLAQLAPVDPDWKELEVKPPALRTENLIPLELPRSSLRFGVDPQSISVGADGVVRYVVVATSPTGVVNAMYEGIKCDTAQVRVYARHSADGGWKAATGEWQPLTTGAQRHSHQIAYTGACMGRGANRTALQITRDLQAPADRRFYTN